MSRAQARRAVQGLITIGQFDTSNETEEGRQHNDNENIRDLLLHDPELQDMVRTRTEEL